MLRDLYGGIKAWRRETAESMGGACAYAAADGRRNVAQPGGKAGGRRLLGPVDINPNMSLQDTVAPVHTSTSRVCASRWRGWTVVVSRRVDPCHAPTWVPTQLDGFSNLHMEEDSRNQVQEGGRTIPSACTSEILADVHGLERPALSPLLPRA